MRTLLDTEHRRDLIEVIEKHVVSGEGDQQAIRMFLDVIAWQNERIIELLEHSNKEKENNEAQ